MLTKLTTTLVAALGMAGTAYADRAPASPDFVEHAPARNVDQDLAASSGTKPMRPMAVLLFEFDRSELHRADRAEVEAARDWIEAHPDSYLVIEGHTDATGTFAYNAGLATRRAEVVRQALITLGAPADRLVVGVFGEARATSPNSAANRRVVLRGTTESLDQITDRTLIDGMAVVWDYQPAATVAARRQAEIRDFFET
jgi:outer membrane protein OmpA-like peptidoglycan-associated protein